MSDRRAARRPNSDQSVSSQALVRFVGDLNDALALQAWADARHAYIGSEPLPRMHALERAAMRHHGIWRSDYR